MFLDRFVIRELHIWRQTIGYPGSRGRSIRFMRNRATSVSSVLEHELRRVHQRPQQVFGRAAARRALLRRTASRACGTFSVGRQAAVRQQVQLVHDLRGRLLALRQRPRSGRRRSSPCGAGSGVFIRCSACTTVVSVVRSQGGSWFGSGRPKLSRNTDCDRTVHTSIAREPGGIAANVSGTPVMSLTVSSSTSARSRWR